MSDKFNRSYKRLVEEEKFVLSNVPGDRGGLTFCGITQVNYPTWKGWELLRTGKEVPSELVRDFYYDEYWRKLNLESITDWRLGHVIMSLSVNMGDVTGVKLAQAAVGAVMDGKLGPKTALMINNMGEDFIYRIIVAATARYAAICNKDSGQRKFLLGWINRVIGFSSL